MNNITTTVITNYIYMNYHLDNKKLSWTIEIWMEKALNEQQQSPILYIYNGLFLIIKRMTNKC